MKFSLGTIVVTAGVGDLMAENEHFKKFVGFSLCRYAECDWGDLVEEDKTQNDEALKYGDRILGAYKHPEHSEWKIWIITEWDRSVTTILFPDEY